MITLEDYLPIVGNEVIANLHQKSRPLYGRRLVHVNSTYQGGGVAEMLERLVPLMNDLGIETDWRVLPGPLDFFSITKQFHNGLQGEPFELTAQMKELYEVQNQAFGVYARLDFDAVVVHDPQPLPLIRNYRKRQPWLWRCHIDLTEPYPPLWEFLQKFILRYDTMIVSSEDYRQEDVPVDQAIISPAIDPLSLKNADMSDKDIAKHLDHLGVKTDLPFVLQVSRYDKWKDMAGVVEAFRKVREDVPSRLVLCGGMAADDPEGLEVYNQTVEAASALMESGDVILLTDCSNAEVNALQRAAAVVTQKSKREGFGLTVTEAMWKARPVVATRVGGIPLQIENDVNGILVAPGHDEQFADAIIRVLRDPELAEELGRNAKEKVRENFLVTKNLEAYLNLLDVTLGC